MLPTWREKRIPYNQQWLPKKFDEQLLKLTKLKTAQPRSHLTQRSLRFRLVENAAKNLLPPGLQVRTAGQVKPTLGGRLRGSSLPNNSMKPTWGQAAYLGSVSPQNRNERLERRTVL